MARALVAPKAGGNGPLAERRASLSEFRALARYELDAAIPLLGQIYRGELTLPNEDPTKPARPPGLATRMRAIELLMKVGVPQQLEVRAWDGDWSQFAPDELERIVAGEHPQDVLDSRRGRP